MLWSIVIRIVCARDELRWPTACQFHKRWINVNIEKVTIVKHDVHSKKKKKNRKMEIHSPVADNSRMTTEPTIYSFIQFGFVSRKPLATLFPVDKPEARTKTTKNKRIFGLPRAELMECETISYVFHSITTDFYWTSSINIKLCHFFCCCLFVLFHPVKADIDSGKSASVREKHR